MAPSQDRRKGSATRVFSCGDRNGGVDPSSFYLPIRQTESFMSSLALILKADITIPDFSSISRRSIELPCHVLSKAMETGSLVIVDSTRLKVYGKDEWHQEKHRFWRANSPHRTSVTPRPFRICLTKSLCPLRLS